VCFKMYNKKFKTNASTKESIIYVFHTGCKVCFYDYYSLHLPAQIYISQAVTINIWQ